MRVGVRVVEPRVLLGVVGRSRERPFVIGVSGRRVLEVPVRLPVVEVRADVGNHVKRRDDLLDGRRVRDPSAVRARRVRARVGERAHKRGAGRRAADDRVHRGGIALRGRRRRDDHRRDARVAARVRHVVRKRLAVDRRPDRAPGRRRHLGVFVGVRARDHVQRVQVARARGVRREVRLELGHARHVNRRRQRVAEALVVRDRRRHLERRADAAVRARPDADVVRRRAAVAVDDRAARVRRHRVGDGVVDAERRHGVALVVVHRDLERGAVRVLERQAPREVVLGREHVVFGRKGRVRGSGDVEVNGHGVPLELRAARREARVDGVDRALEDGVLRHGDHEEVVVAVPQPRRGLAARRRELDVRRRRRERHALVRGERVRRPRVGEVGDDVAEAVVHVRAGDVRLGELVARLGARLRIVKARARVAPAVGAACRREVRDAGRSKGHDVDGVLRHGERDGRARDL
mmetsp:Transcript_11552/g.35600  ORF Transcript_11552/g.35600 Transcript_11552/m.35600 type:complete len:464 (+) Transcript_11552:2354-3745(+)